MTNNRLFDIAAPFYDLFIHTNQDISIISEKLELPTTGLIYEAGGGTGRIAANLLAKNPFVIVGDFSYKMLQQAKKKKGLLVLQNASEFLPFANNTFERILVVDALHHFENQQKAIGELLRVLKTNGKMMIQEPNIASIYVKLIAIAEKIAGMGSTIHTAAKIQNMVSFYGYASEIIIDKHTIWVIINK